MTTEPEQTHWSVASLLDLFDVQPGKPDQFSGDTGIAGDDERQVVEGTQVLAQAIVAVAKRFPDKSVRSAHAVFARAVMVGPPVEFSVEILNEGRSTATAIVAKGRPREMTIESLPEYAVVQLSGMREKFPVPWEEVYAAAKRRHEANLGLEKLAKRRPGRRRR